MVQIRPATISLQLTPMRIPEAVPSAGFAFANQENINETTGTSLLLHPGEPSELIVQIKNLTQRNLQLDLIVEGDFPRQWCWVGTEGREILPGEQMDAVLYFHVPATFFENQEAITPEKEQLRLNFSNCQVVAYTDRGTNQEQVQEANFNLYIRPWSAYMNFLPVLYREVDFIGRFMKIFEQAYQPVIDSYAVMWANLDPLTAPRALLPFLAHWVAWPVDSIWNLPQQRRLIRRAVEIYRWRGTRKGLRLYLHLYTGLPLDEDLPNEADKHISITEPFGDDFTLGEAELGEAVLGGGQAYHFVVRLRPDNINSIDEQLVRRIIDQEKPAFCTYELFIDNPII
ncbi:MAG: phage tail protein [Calothrix sp. C42_A2020_038]|nr:phage tail protein [Calothrix sp. C42_A2020_038]